MKRKMPRRLLVILLAVLAAAGVAIVLFERLTAEPDPLTVAKRVPTGVCDAASAQLLSNGDVACHDAPWVVAPGSSPTWTRVACASGMSVTRDLTECPPGTHTEVAISPDGEWVLCLDCGGDDRQGTLRRVHSGRTARWPIRGDVYHYDILWMPDSRHWTSFGTVPDGAITVYDVDRPSLITRVPFPMSARAVSGNFIPCADGRLLVLPDDPNRAGDAPAEIIECRIGARVEEIATHLARPPVHGETTNLDLSPDGKHIVWSITRDRTSPVAAVLHRVIRGWPEISGPMLSVWVTDLDGRHARDLGFIRLLDEQESGRRVCWLPDGRKLSFVHGGALYMVDP